MPPPPRVASLAVLILLVGATGTKRCATIETRNQSSQTEIPVFLRFQKTGSTLIEHAKQAHEPCTYDAQERCKKRQTHLEGNHEILHVFAKVHKDANNRTYSKQAALEELARDMCPGPAPFPRLVVFSVLREPLSRHFSELYYAGGLQRYLGMLYRKPALQPCRNASACKTVRVEIEHRFLEAPHTVTVTEMEGVIAMWRESTRDYAGVLDGGRAVRDGTVSVVGLTEYQGATKALFADEFVWAYDFCQPEHFENVNPNHPLQKDFSCDVINSTKRAFGDDIRVYEEARAAFRKRLMSIQERLVSQDEATLHRMCGSSESQPRCLQCIDGILASALESLKGPPGRGDCWHTGDLPFTRVPPKAPKRAQSVPGTV